VEWLTEANVTEKSVVSIFRAEAKSWDSRGIILVGRKGSLKERANQIRTK
jgi:hypothetical protein